MAGPSHPPSPPPSSHVRSSGLHTARIYGGTIPDLEPVFVCTSSHATQSDSPPSALGSPYPPALTAFLVAVPNPLRPLPLLFSSVLGLSSYLSFTGHHIDAAGISASWSALYIIAASRRKQRFIGQFSGAGILRGMTMGVCALNVLGGGLAYTFGQRSKEDEERASKERASKEAI